MKPNTPESVKHSAQSPPENTPQGPFGITGTVHSGPAPGDVWKDVFLFEEQPVQNKWSVSWSDLMMTMFILFAVMYIFQIGDKDLTFGPGPGRNQISDQGGGQVINPSVNTRAIDIFDSAKGAIRDVLVDDNINANLVDSNTVKITLAADLMFDLGQADLKTGARFQLDQIVPALMDNDYMINVSGHTDDAPTRSARFPTNWDLSSQRAISVVRYLTQTAGIDPARFFITAHSHYQPLGPNTSSRNRALNRRVEITLTRQKL